MTNSKIHDYTDLGIVSSILPSQSDSSFLIEVATDTLYILKEEGGGPDKTIYKTIDKCDNWSSIEVRDGAVFSLFWDKINDRLYIMGYGSSTPSCDVAYIDLTDDTITELGAEFATLNNRVPRDIWIRDGNIEVLIDQTDNDDLEVWRWNGAAWAEIDDIGRGAAGTTSYVTVVGTDVYFHALDGTTLHMYKFDGTTLASQDSIVSTSQGTPNTRYVSYDDSNILLFIGVFDGDNYLYEYNITTTTITKKSIYNIGLQLNRNTSIGILEKGFHLTEDKIYRISNTRINLFLISIISTDAIWIAITDNFIMNADGDIFELIEFTESYSKFEIEHPRNDIPTAQALRVRDDFPIVKGMIIRCVGNYTSASVTTTDVQFEGYVVDYDEQKMEKVWLESPARELLEIKPFSGEFRDLYTGRTDEIISNLISDYCQYVSVGTLVAGIAKGNVFFDGDTSLFTILRDFAKEDGFVWALTPTGVLNYHLSVDSGVDIDETDNIWAVETSRPHRDVNRVDVRGAFINTVEIKGSWDDETSQDANGIQRFTYRDSKVRTVALADALALQLGTDLAVNAKEANFFYKNISLGLIQVAEEVTLQYNTNNINIASNQHILDYVKFFAIEEESDMTATDTLLIATEGFRNQTIDEQVEQNNTLIQQNRESINTKTGWLVGTAVTLSFTDGTRTFTITPTGDNFSYWIQGTKYTKLALDIVVIDDTEGLWYIYYVADVLAASQTPWEIKDGDKGMVAVVYWDATANHHHYLGYELHSFEMSPAIHEYNHETIGTNFVSGLALVNGTGGDDGKVALDGGECYDEDIEIEITDGAGSGLFEQELGNTSVFAAAQIPVFYRSGATDWDRYTAGDFPFYDNGGGDNVHFNDYSDPNWSSTEATNSAKYIAMWLFATNNQSEPIIAIMGQDEYATLNACKDGALLENLAFGTLPFSEMKILYRLIFKSNSTWAHTEDMRSVSNVPGGTYVPAPVSHPISDIAYDEGTWNANLDAATKNVLRDKIEAMVKMAQETYTGNGNNNRQITGLGFDPTYMTIGYLFSGAVAVTWEKHADTGEWEAYRHDNNNREFNSIRFITDGFEVNNGHAGDQMNDSGKVYEWTAFG